MIGILVTVLVQSSSTSTSIIVSMVNSQNMLEKLTSLIVEEAFNYEGHQTATKVKILKHITEPFTKNIIEVDSKVLSGWSQGDPAFDNLTLSPCYNAKLLYPNNTEKIDAKCDYLFAKLDIGDTKIGIILLVASLFLLCFALIMIVKLLKSMLKGAIANLLRKFINANIPYVPWLTGYIALLFGAIMTVIVQSSSIFTSTLTPLIGLGLISVDRAYPLTLGSNIGTTTTALLASIAGEGEGLKRSVQIALVHLFFNIIGILIFYPIPFMRFPIKLCKMLGNITADYRWFAIVYLIGMFFVLPALVFLLSLGGPKVMECVGIPILIILAVVILINILQNHCSKVLPQVLKNWDFLPLPLRSLEPYDRVFLSIPCCKSCRVQAAEEEKEEDSSVPSTVIIEKTPPGVDNVVFVKESSHL
ncbi:Sodium-dependent phosphate transport protein 2B [Armadillidium nasatum]|uniref:Sodium-dependent phosphate transport protein 2B n=1 Tax=Armadillidium nasatum TaxID=96803 RepID=A0A5N5SYS2_9CRUS|nr:Sodium-dependent phosphate transport protein 2B [Armadillidium nasatum]